MNNLIPLNKKLGIIGGGQLGKMLLDVTSKWNINTYILDPNKFAPARLGCNKFFQGDLNDYETVYNFGKNLDIITFEIEHINVDALDELKLIGKKVYPKPETLRIIQNKSSQKDFFKINSLPTADYKKFNNKSDLINYINKSNFKFPFIWKAARFGYDGFGVKKILSKRDIEKLPDCSCLIEDLVDIKKEISIIASRNVSGEVKLFPAVEMLFNQNSNQIEYVCYPSDIDDLLLKKAELVSEKLVKSWNHVGLLAVEFFIDKKNNILINEVAPRPHNSGHLTIEGCETSQYEQHIRCIFDFPLGNSKIYNDIVMMNVVGPPKIKGEFELINIDKILKKSSMSFHFYGKKITKPNRKLGHITMRGGKKDKILNELKKVKSTLKIIEKT